MSVARSGPKHRREFASESSAQRSHRPRGVGPQRV